ncbi:hypothetical protein CEW81_21415 [Kluyvera genomosp. 3]|uniref:Uncharacterized protein n=1 Tax=Kluyvera genomosp. 3 TaxID=2774055 RepID=A0A248KLC0_9ENTR|nr:hypothetical protein CEW81_21415 [Kluyvera genomosp. 3]
MLKLLGELLYRQFVAEYANAPWRQKLLDFLRPIIFRNYQPFCFAIITEDLFAQFKDAVVIVFIKPL